MATRQGDEFQQFYQKIVEQAWADPAFKARALANPKAAMQEVGGPATPANVTIRVYENTPDTLHFILPEKSSATAKSASTQSAFEQVYQKVIERAWADPAFKTRLLA